MADGYEGVRVISRSALVRFWSGRKHDAAIAERDLNTWLTVTRAAKWANFGALKQTFGSAADLVGDCVVFDVGNNRFRLIGRLRYRAGKVYVLKVMDHGEYDKKRWVRDCGCFDPPPKKGPRPKTGPPGTKPQSHRPGKGK